MNQILQKKALFCGIFSSLLLVSCQKEAKESTDTPSHSEEEIHLVATVPEPTLPEELDFNEHVQPILSEYCYHCHGPDSGTREPKAEPLRLDIAKDALAIRENGKAAIIPGDPKGSSVVTRMHETDPHEIMPPPESHKTMNAKEIAILEKWILDGAEYKEHWSFIKPEKADIPETPDPEWNKNPIDGFVYQKLKNAGLEPSQEEEPHRLLRRLSFDLRGLAPTTEEVEAFEASYEAAPDEAEEMMNTAAYAEHMARYWLDAARYADTHGIHLDNIRNIWPYRDWVIKAFEKNMPFDQFTIEQLSGDLLPNASVSQKVATGFNRCLPTTGEGGAIPEEYDAIYATDRVETMSAIWLGLTTGCAACHDHKFDPISTKEFYQLTAFFRNTNITAMDQNDRNHLPFIFAPVEEDLSAWEKIDEEVSLIQKKLNERKKLLKTDFDTWLAGDRELDFAKADISIPFTDKLNHLRGIRNGVTKKYKGSGSIVPSPHGPVYKFRYGSHSVNFDEYTSKEASPEVSIGGYMNVGRLLKGAIFSLTEKSGEGFSLNYRSKRFEFAHYNDSNKAVIRVESVNETIPGVWQHVFFTYDYNKSPAEAVNLYIDGRLVPTRVLEKNEGGAPSFTGAIDFGKRNEGGDLQNGPLFTQDLRIYKKALSQEGIKEILRKGRLEILASTEGSTKEAGTRKQLEHAYALAFDSEYQKLEDEKSLLVVEQNKLRVNGGDTLVMEEKKNSTPTAHVLIRGAYQNKGEKVGANVPSVLPPLTEDEGVNRLSLAKWLVQPENPLPARVTVNRFWSYFFGAGIVGTNSDFGIMGARPSHPKMLDWLAVDFIEQGWDLRKLLTTIVTSKTYRQSANASPQKYKDDPENSLLSRGPRYRLDGEQIRDHALAASSLLVNKIGGRPAKPYQPEGVWTIAMKQSNTKVYVQDHGDNLYRRSVYTFWKRQAPPASMEILDAPQREVFCVNRARTNTPLQALVTLNDTQFVETSRHIAQNALTQKTERRARIDYIFQSLLSRPAYDKEFEVLVKSQQGIEKLFKAEPERIEQLLSVGESPVNSSIDKLTLASWTMLASQVFNLDENLTK